MRTAIALLALALATTGCKKKETKPAEPVGGSAVGSDPGSAAAGSDVGSGSAMAGSDTAGSAGSAAAGSAGSAAETTMTKKSGNCPSTVFGATTKAAVKGKAVVVTITSKDKDTVLTIQRRADELVKEKKDGSTPGAAHDQKGTHGGGMGICPVYVPEGATAAYKKDKAGASVTITPKEKPDDLKKEIDTRITKADEWVKANIKPGDKGNQGGVGGGKGEHGGNHSGEGDAKGQERKKAGGGGGGGKDTGGGGGKGTGGGTGGGKGGADSGSATK